MCWSGICKDVRRRERKGKSCRVGWRGYLDVTGGTNKNQKVPHLDARGVFAHHHRSVKCGSPRTTTVTPLLPTIQYCLPSLLAPQLPSGPPLSPSTRLTLVIVATRQVHVNRAEPPPQNTIHHFTLELGSPATKHWLAVANPIHHTRILCSSHSPLLTCGLWLHPTPAYVNSP